MPICRQTKHPTVPEAAHSDECSICGEDHSEHLCPMVDYSTRTCADCGRQQLEYSKEAQEYLCPNCGWPLGR